jgi:transposase
MKIRNEIMDKVRKREEYLVNRQRCLDACVCPGCGNDLERHITDDENLPDEVFKCSLCGFAHRRAWA